MTPSICLPVQFSFVGCILCTALYPGSHGTRHIMCHIIFTRHRMLDGRSPTIRPRSGSLTAAQVVKRTKVDPKKVGDIQIGDRLRVPRGVLQRVTRGCSGLDPTLTCVCCPPIPSPILLWCYGIYVTSHNSTHSAFTKFFLAMSYSTVHHLQQSPGSRSLSVLGIGIAVATDTLGITRGVGVSISHRYQCYLWGQS